MNEEVRSVILELFDEAYAAFKDEDSNKLKEISNYTLHSAGVFQDRDSTSVAILVYSLAKVLERKKMHKYKQWELFSKDTLNHIKNARVALNNLDFENYNFNVHRIFKHIGKLEQSFGMYVTEVIKQARIKKGSGVYEHGISISRAAELMGVSPWDLSEFIGQKRGDDKIPMVTKSVKERLKFARELFK